MLIRIPLLTLLLAGLICGCSLKVRGLPALTGLGRSKQEAPARQARATPRARTEARAAPQEPEDPPATQQAVATRPDPETDTETSAKTADAPKPASPPTSPLESLDEDALVERAVRELMGQGNGAKTSQPDPTEKPVQTAVTVHSYEDQLILLRRVWAPAINDKENVRTLQKARCAEDLRKKGTKWNKTIGEAIDEKVCDAQVKNEHVYLDPATKYAFAELLLAKHPRREELLSEVALHIARTRGAGVRWICYRSEQKPYPVLKLDEPCTAMWNPSQWDGYRWVVNMKAFFFEEIPPAKMKFAQLDVAERFLSKVKPTTRSFAEGKALLAKVKATKGPKLARRTRMLQKKRAASSALISTKVLLNDFGDAYLWHSTCGKPYADRRFEGNTWVKSKMLCVKVATESEDECLEREHTYRMYPGSSQWEHWGTSYDATDVDCP